MCVKCKVCMCVTQVFEINASSLRNRTQLVKKLREVFHSCQVRPSPCFRLKNQNSSQITISQSSVILVDEVRGG